MSTVKQLGRTGPGDSRIVWFSQYSMVLAVFLLLAVFTRSRVYNDTYVYVDDITSSVTCPSISQCGQIWDAGHLLWRPIGRALFLSVGPMVKHMTGATDFVTVLLLLQMLSALAIAVGACLLYAILATFGGRPLVLIFVTTTFLCTCEMLYALHSGTSYPSGLACILAGIWWARSSSTSSTMRAAAITGVFGALAVAFWLPYVVALPALLLLVIVYRQSRQLEAGVVLIISTVVIGCVSFGIGAHFAHVQSMDGLKAWIQSSGHGTYQTHNFVRSLFGLPRSFMDFGRFGIRSKQFLLKDPYANVHLGELLSGAVWKIVLFYLALAGLMLICLTRDGLKVCVILGIALVGNMSLAMTFEGGSPERYLPMYPFLFMAAGYCLSKNHAPKVSQILIVSLFLVVILGNLPVSSVWNIRAEQKELAERIGTLPPLPTDSLLYIVGDDPVAHISQVTAINKLDKLPPIKIYNVYVPLMNTAAWKHDFAARVLSTWEHGGDVVVTLRVWSPSPKRDWNWAEGDDPNVRWQDITRFFASLDHEPMGKNDDGFAILTRSSTNQELLNSFAKESLEKPKPKY
jgi:hypothetical protein